MAASDLRKAQDKLLYDLIEESNPGFQAKFPLDKIQFGTPSVKTVDSADTYKRDTTVTVSARAGSGFIGAKTLSYRRIDMTALFRNMVCQIQTWAPLTTTSLSKALWVSEVNKRFGIVTLPADWNNADTLPVGNLYTGITVSGLCYKGSVSLQWVRGKRPMSDLIQDSKQVMVGRLYPGGNDLTNPSRKPEGEFQTYGIDFSSLSANLDANNASFAMQANTTSAGLTALLNFLNANTGRTNWSNKDSTVDGGICGLTWFKYTIPATQVPEANFNRFNRVIVIQGVAGSWFTGKILIHYNV